MAKHETSGSKDTVFSRLAKRYLTRDLLWSFSWMMAAIIVMGVGLSCLFIADMGTDPLSTMNRGLAMALPISYGNCQLLCNIVFILLMILFQRNQIGAAPAMYIRIIMLVVGMGLFLITAAVYMCAELGTVPYDAFPILLASRLPFSFRTVRMAVDAAAICIGWICGNQPGIMTVLIFLTLGPVIAWFGKHTAVKLFRKKTSFI